VGAVVNSMGGLPASANDKTLAKGFKFNCFAFSALINSTALAPSLSFDELAAVTVPPSF
jgi:hypothetical protein